MAVAKARTGAERYLARRLEGPEYRQAYEKARDRIEQIDSVIRAFDDRRKELHLTKAELARRAGVKPEAIRRLFSTERPNPTLATLVALADALDLEIRPTPGVAQLLERRPPLPERCAVVPDPPVVPRLRRAR